MSGSCCKVYTVLGAYITLFTGFWIFAHYTYHKVWNVYHLSLTFFLLLNLLVCYFEITLFFYRDEIVKGGREIMEKYGTKVEVSGDTALSPAMELAPVATPRRRVTRSSSKQLARENDDNDVASAAALQLSGPSDAPYSFTFAARKEVINNLFFHPIEARDLLSCHFWCKIWTTYSVYDTGYAGTTSFGYWIDAGNGFSTLIPSIVVLMGMTFDSLSIFCDTQLNFVITFSPFWVGLLGALSFYQEFYGTVVYFTQFIVNKRHADKSWSEIFLFILLSNGMWFVFPLVGMYVCVNFMRTNSFDIVRINSFQ